MLEKVDFAKKLDKEEFKEKMPELERKIAGLQRRCRELKIPVMIVFEGFDAAGKGLQIGWVDLQSGIHADLKCSRSKKKQKKNRCIRFCGDSGRRRRRKDGLRFSTEAGAGKS